MYEREVASQAKRRHTAGACARTVVGRSKKASPERFEHSRAKPNRWQLLIAGDPVNHSGKVT